MRTPAILALLSIILVATATAQDVRVIVLDSTEVKTFSWIGRSGHRTIQAKWIKLSVSSDDKPDRPMSLWCMHESRTGLSLWWPSDGGIPQEPHSGFVNGLWIDDGIVGLWSLALPPRGFHVWASRKRTSSLQHSCEWAVQSFSDSYADILSRIESQGKLRFRPLVGHTIDLGPFVGKDPWVRGEGGWTRGGMAAIDRIVPRKRNKGWLMVVNGLDGIRYEVKLDRDLRLVDGKRIKPAQRQQPRGPLIFKLQ